MCVAKHISKRPCTAYFFHQANWSAGLKTARLYSLHARGEALGEGGGGGEGVGARSPDRRPGCSFTDRHGHTHIHTWNRYMDTINIDRQLKNSHTKNSNTVRNKQRRISKYVLFTKNITKKTAKCRHNLSILPYKHYPFLNKMLVLQTFWIRAYY